MNRIVDTRTRAVVGRTTRTRRPEWLSEHCYIELPGERVVREAREREARSRNTVSKRQSRLRVVSK